MQILDCEIKVLELAHPVGQKRFRGIAYEFCVDEKWLRNMAMFIKLLVKFKLSKSLNHAYNKLFKRDSQRVAFLLCVDFFD